MTKLWKGWVLAVALVLAFVAVPSAQAGGGFGISYTVGNPYDGYLTVGSNRWGHDRGYYYGYDRGYRGYDYGYYPRRDRYDYSYGYYGPRYYNHGYRHYGYRHYDYRPYRYNRWDRHRHYNHGHRHHRRWY